MITSFISKLTREGGVAISNAIPITKDLKSVALWIDSTTFTSADVVFNIKVEESFDEGKTWQHSISGSWKGGDPVGRSGKHGMTWYVGDMRPTHVRIYVENSGRINFGIAGEIV